MTQVFIGGSITLSNLNENIKRRIDNILKKEYTVLIGDANGVDRAVQRYLFERQYKNVQVFCMDDCRNNLGNWKTKHVRGGASSRDANYYSLKDVEMANETDYGFMIWDGKSRGTLKNILNLFEKNKKVLVYFSPTSEFYNLIKRKDVTNLLKRCNTESLIILEKKVGISKYLNQEPEKQYSLLRE